MPLRPDRDGLDPPLRDPVPPIAEPSQPIIYPEVPPAGVPPRLSAPSGPYQPPKQDPEKNLLQRFVTQSEGDISPLVRLHNSENFTTNDYDDTPWTRDELQSLAWQTTEDSDWESASDPEAGSERP